ncbi:hypothetical protein NLX83_07660 [Allokutzneria sp. A3M-2-11 16]|uniref:hypothetical protein n=1 Tax=Allokutzneria sp. A3M-2-11 16 TaxID=2962043 RepID=UPI0020B67BCF|nr:hypothetical protein [Allokutzneria sp. A3M-2-11 16]MCP3799128.1 hypothetical protein [Allokutzneria sp. A3M-2-11 16]
MLRAAAALLLLATAGCQNTITGEAALPGVGDAERALVVRHVDDGNAAAAKGSAAQQELYRKTQHPDFHSGICQLNGLTVLTEPVWSTLRPDPKWSPGGNSIPPRGNVYVVAVSVSTRRDNTTVGNQIGSQHVVVLNGMAYGFAPCPN